jgi:peptidyl-prolyl cis-trans isomerase C
MKFNLESNMTKKILPSALLAAALSSVSMHAAAEPSFPEMDATPAQSEAPPARPEILATVNGVAIPMAYFDYMKQERMAQGQPDTPNLDRAVREALINAEVLSQEAVRQGFERDPALALHMELIRKEVLAKALIEDFVQKNPISDETIQAEFDKIKARSGDKEYHVRHILVDSEKEAKDIIAQLKKKADFESLAKEKSKDGSAAEGGDIGWTVPSNLVKEFADAMMALKPGEYSKSPVQTQFGWHVLKLDEVRDIEYPPFEEVKHDLLPRLQQEQLRKAIAGYRAQARIE